MVESNLPLIFLKEVVLLPFNEIRIEVSSNKDKEVINYADSKCNGYLLCINLEDSREENPNVRSLPKIGILAKIKSKIELSNGIIRLVLIGIDRVEVLNYSDDNNITHAFVIPTKEYDYSVEEANALRRILLKKLDEYIEISPYVSNNVLGRINGINNISRLSDIIVYELPLEYLSKLKYITTPSSISRLRSLVEDLNKEIETVKLETDIESNLKDRLDIEQKKYVLREKIKLIREELEEDDSRETDIDNIRTRLSNGNYPEHIKNRIEIELKRYQVLYEHEPEISLVRNYLDWLINLPYNKKTEDNKDINSVRKKLDESHYGLSDIKERILEYLVVSDRVNNAPIICLVGPPGVGKSTMARSIAEAINKEFVKLSVGGLDDSSTLVGHRKTYIGSYPGKIIQLIRKCGSNNPLFLIDEVDKINSNSKGDPASVLLDILDKEQNSRFQDNYLEEEFDLSNVLFMLTANDVSKIPEPLRDRLEIIYISSYTVSEKLEIALNYIIPKLKREYLFSSIEFSKEALLDIINYYTKESGVRELERMITKIFRKIIIDNDNNSYLIDDVTTYLGNHKYVYLSNEKNNKSGISNILGYTPYGGVILKCTSSHYNGNGNIIMTGSLGDDSKESASVALSYIKTNSSIFEIDNKLFNDDIHIHIESGGVKKNGVSGGISLVTTLISMYKEVPISNTIGMTGEITLRGKILPVSGLREKLIAASIGGIKTVYIPKDNKNEVIGLDDNITSKLKIKYVDDYMEIYNDLFKEKK